MLKELSILLLVYNEEKSIETDIKLINKYIKSKIKKCEIIIIEDFSTDKTYKILKRIKKNINIKILRGKKRLGYRNSLVKGLNAAKYHNVFFTESGNKYNFKEFNNFSKKYNQQLVYSGFRSPRFDSLSRKLLTYMLNFLIRRLFKFDAFDFDSGYKLINKKKFFNYYVKKQKYKDFGSCFMLINMKLNKEKIYEKKISYYQRPDESKQFSFFKIIKKSIYLISELIKIKLKK